MDHTKIQYKILITLLFAIIFATAVNAHPGHGTPEIVSSDDNTGGSTNTGGTTDSDGSTNTGGTSDSSSSTYTGGSSDSGGSSSVQSITSQNNGGSDTGGNSIGGNDDGVVSSTSENLKSSPGGPAALIGLMVVASLILLNFPFKNGKFSNFQDFFGG